MDPELLQDEQAGHCVSIRETEEEGEFGICVLDAATGEFNLSGFKDDVVRTRLEVSLATPELLPEAARLNSHMSRQSFVRSGRKNLCSPRYLLCIPICGHG